MLDHDRRAEQHARLAEILGVYGVAYLPPDHSEWQPAGNQTITGKIIMSPNNRLATVWGEDGSLLIGFSEVLAHVL